MLSKSVKVLAMAAVFLFLASPFAAFATEGTSDDLFGYHFDSNLLPSNTQGLRATYSMSQTGITLSCSNGGWVGTVDTLRIVGGSPDEWLLQGFVGLGCSGSTEYWNVQWAYFDNNNNYHTGNLASLSISSYSSLSGTISIYYDGSNWILSIYVSQNTTTYTYNFGSAGGTKADGGNNDWTAVETDYKQVGLTFSSSFDWEIEYPYFLVGGTWQNWNVSGSNYKELQAYAIYQPSKTGNTVGVTTMSTPGVYVYIGTSYTNDEVMSWCISGTCPNVVLRA